MSRKTIGGLVALVAVGAATVAVASQGNDGASARPSYASVTVDLGDANTNARSKAAVPKKPRLVYLQSSEPVPINPAPPPVGVGRFIDVTLAGCAKVVDGGVVPSIAPGPDPAYTVYQQGSYVQGKNEYHVLLAHTGNQEPFTITSHLTCLKGVK